MSCFTGARHVERALARWFDAEPRAMLVGETVGRGGIGGSTSGLAELHPERVLDTPVGDRGPLGLGFGLALGGRPVCVELPGLRSLLDAWGVLVDAAHAAAGPALTVRVPFEQGLGGSVEPDLGVVLDMQGISVHVPCASTVGALLEACLGRGLHVVLEPADLYAERAEPIVAEPGRARVLRRGAHLTVIAWGAGLHAARQAAERLAAEGVELELVDPVSVRPLDPAIGERIRQTGRVLVVHDGSPSLAGRLLAELLPAVFLYLEAPPRHCRATPQAVADAALQSVHY